MADLDDPTMKEIKWKTESGSQKAEITVERDPHSSETSSVAKTMAGQAGVAGRLFDWKKNARRHSFISYRVAQTQDVDKVALEAGNSPRMACPAEALLVKGGVHELPGDRPTEGCPSLVPHNPDQRGGGEGGTTWVEAGERRGHAQGGGGVKGAGESEPRKKSRFVTERLG